MAELPRLNGIIRALESGQHALTCFSPPTEARSTGGILIVAISARETTG